MLELNVNAAFFVAVLIEFKEFPYEQEACRFVHLRAH
jgi:hypothetical protein